MNCTFRNGILGSLVIATMSLTSVAGTVTWTGGGDGVNWSDSGNWGGTAPSAGDMLVISNTVAGTTLYLTKDGGVTTDSFMRPSSRYSSVFSTGTFAEMHRHSVERTMNGTARHILKSILPW